MSHHRPIKSNTQTALKAFQERRVKYFLDQLSHSRISKIRSQRIQHQENFTLRRSTAKGCRTPLRKEGEEKEKQESATEVFELEHAYVTLKAFLSLCQARKWTEALASWKTFQRSVSELSRKKILCVNFTFLSDLFKCFSRLDVCTYFEDSEEVLLFRELIQELARQSDNPVVEWQEHFHESHTWASLDVELKLHLRYRETYLNQVSEEKQQQAKQFQGDSLKEYLFEKDSSEPPPESFFDLFGSPAISEEQVAFVEEEEEREEEEEEEEGCDEDNSDISFATSSEEEEDEEDGVFSEDDLEEEEEEEEREDDQEEEEEEEENLIKEEVLSSFQEYQLYALEDEIPDKSFWSLSSSDTRNLLQKCINTFSLRNLDQQCSCSDLVDLWTSFSYLLKVILLNPRTKYLLEEDFEAFPVFWSNLQTSLSTLAQHGSMGEFLDTFACILHSFSILSFQLTKENIECLLELCSTFYTLLKDRTPQQHFFDDFARSKIWSYTCHLLYVYVKQFTESSDLIFHLKTCLGAELLFFTSTWMDSNLILKYIWFGLLDLKSLSQKETDKQDVLKTLWILHAPFVGVSKRFQTFPFSHKLQYLVFKDMQEIFFSSWFAFYQANEVNLFQDLSNSLFEECSQEVLLLIQRSWKCFHESLDVQAVSTLLLSLLGSLDQLLTFSLREAKDLFFLPHLTQALLEQYPRVETQEGVPFNSLWMDIVCATIQVLENALSHPHPQAQVVSKQIERIWNIVFEQISEEQKRKLKTQESFIHFLQVLATLKASLTGSDTLVGLSKQAQQWLELPLSLDSLSVQESSSHQH